ncbi:phosphopantetheine-binding protein [Paralcaligenes sp. KSB-10]|jgi:D-alanine--poly(phosphoribitol) ligase subunit 2|uniref:acyl carrier protein n=1 Tax=Paralcaligenes sp. KSB-10 TaxID=2901142 RepID=UPI001E4E7BDE|nr:phosphopantetheine-binding protein [Paralcaligenes sp. KSB-10]UHL65074.1 phosphopantetheine-binding protein [Paralcaligenes sp. KSB-10]
MLVAQNIEIEILAIVESVIFKSVAPDTSLVKSGLVDSMAAVDIALAIEDKFGCGLPAPEIAQILESVKSITAYVAANT